LADWLVREAGLPFREAHHVTGRAVALAEAKGCRLDELSLEEFKSVDTRITGSAMSVLTVEKSVRSRTSFGGTAPNNVLAQVSYWRDRINAESIATANDGV
jgi:argininosuccinate lyase